MRVECPFCKAKYSVRKKDAESIILMSKIKYGYDPLDRERNVLVWPCGVHMRKFEEVMKNIMEKQKLANAEYRRELSRELKRIKSRVFKVTEKIIRKELKKLKDGEGLIVWVSDGVEKDGEYRDLAVAYVKEGGEIKKLYGDTKPRVSYSEGRSFSATHYIAQELDILLYEKQDIKWKGILQGLVVSGEKLRRVINAVFMMTHDKPRASLIEFLRYPSGLGSADIREAKEAGEKIDDLYALVDIYRVEEAVRRKVEEKYGVPIHALTPTHLKKYIERLNRETEKEEVLN